MKFASLVPASLVFCFSVSACVWAQGEPAKPAGDLASLLAQAEVLVAADRLAEAELIYTEAAGLAPSNNQVLTELGKLKSRLGDHENAVELLRRVAAAQPASGEAHLNLAIALADSDRLPDALKESESAVRLNPRNASAHLNQARLLADLHRDADAQREFARAAALAPRDPSMAYFWGVFEADHHRHVAAVALLEKATAHEAADARALYLLGQEQEALGHRAQAIAEWKKAIAVEPKLQEAVYALAQALRENDPAKSVELLRQFEQLRQSNQSTERVRELGNQAYAAMQDQRWDAAVASLHQALELCGTCTLQADLHQRLGLAECHRGNVEAGTRELRLALSLNPHDRETVQALQWVAEHTK